MNKSVRERCDLGEGGTGELHYDALEGQVCVTVGVVETSNKLTVNVKFQF
jgi:hypothetical protein